MKNVFLIAFLLLICQQSVGQPVGKKQPDRHYSASQVHHQRQRIYYDVGGFERQHFSAKNSWLLSAGYNGRYGFIDTNGHEVVKCRYKYVSEFKDGHALVASSDSDDHQGIIDSTGKEVVPCAYTFITTGHSCRSVNTPDFTKSFVVTQKGRYGLIYPSGKVALPCIYDELYNYKEGMAVAVFHYKYGVIDEAGVAKVPFKYYRIKRTGSEGLYAVRAGKTGGYLWGFADTTGQEVVPCSYDEVKLFSGGYAAVQEDSLWGFIDKAGRKVISCKYQNAESFQGGFAAVKKNGRWGLIDRWGKLKLKYQYSHAPDSIGRGLLRVWDNMRKYAVIDTNGTPLSSYKYDFVGRFSNNRALVSINDVYGYINTNGKEVIPCQYEKAENFSSGMAKVVLRRGDDDPMNWVTVDIDTNGVMITNHPEYSPHYISADIFREQMAAVKNSDLKVGFININGKEVIPCKFDRVGDFSCGYAAVKLDCQWYFVDRQGRDVFQTTYENIEDGFINGFAAVKKNGLYGVIDTNGKVVLPFSFEYIGFYENGLAPACIDGQWCYIDRQGKEIIMSEEPTMPFFDGIGAVYYGDSTYYIDTNCNKILCLNRGRSFENCFSDSMTSAGDDVKGGYMDIKGRVVIAPKYRYLNFFHHGTASVAIEDEHGVRWGIIDKKGNTIVPCVYEAISALTVDGIALVKLNGRYGFINRSGKLVIPNIYDVCNNLPDYKDGLIPVKKDGHWIYIDKTGRRVLWLP